MFFTTRIKRVVDLTLDCVLDKQQRYCDPPPPLVWAMVVSQRGPMIIQHTAAVADAITILANTKMWENTSRQSVVRHVRDIRWNTLHSGENRCTHKLGQIHRHVVKATFATQICSLKQKPLNDGCDKGRKLRRHWWKLKHFALFWEDVLWWELQLGIFQQTTDDMPSSVGALEYLHSNSSLSLSLRVTYNQFVKYIELAPPPSEWASQECNWVNSKKLTWQITWCHVHQDWLTEVAHIYFQHPENTEIYCRICTSSHSDNLSVTRSPIELSRARQNKA